MASVFKQSFLWGKSFNICIKTYAKNITGINIFTVIIVLTKPRNTGGIVCQSSQDFKELLSPCTMKQERINFPISMRAMVSIVLVIPLFHRLRWQARCREGNKI